jgi:hypothetical protein
LNKPVLASCIFDKNLAQDALCDSNTLKQTARIHCIAKYYVAATLSRPTRDTLATPAGTGQPALPATDPSGNAVTDDQGSPLYGTISRSKFTSALVTVSHSFNY